MQYSLCIVVHPCPVPNDRNFIWFQAETVKPDQFTKLVNPNGPKINVIYFFTLSHLVGINYSLFIFSLEMGLVGVAKKVMSEML